MKRTVLVCWSVDVLLDVLMLDVDETCRFDVSMSPRNIPIISSQIKPVSSLTDRELAKTAEEFRPETDFD